MSRPVSPSYKTENWPSYNDAPKQRGSLTVRVDPDMVWVLPPMCKRGRQPQYGDAAIQTCLTMTVPFGMALRQTPGLPRPGFSGGSGVSMDGAYGTRRQSEPLFTRGPRTRGSTGSGEPGRLRGSVGSDPGDRAGDRLQRRVPSPPGGRNGVTSEDGARIEALGREVRELRQASGILKKASAYSAQAELDRPFRR